MLTESEQTVGDEANLAAGWRRDQANVTQVLAKCAGDGNAPDGFHPGERIHQSFILAFLKSVHEDSSILVSRELKDGHLHVDCPTELSTGSHRSCVDNPYTSVVRGNDESDRQQERDETETAVAEFANSRFAQVALSRRCSP
jgi:hypothetical protein